MTGVQTCALPSWGRAPPLPRSEEGGAAAGGAGDEDVAFASNARSVVASWLPDAGGSKEDEHVIERLPARVGLGAQYIAQAKVGGVVASCVCTGV